MKACCKNFLLVLIFTILIAPQAQAASEDECAIWICLPAGFGHPACSGAQSAMIRRLKDFKPPLPNIMSCVVNGDGGSNMSYDYSYAAYVPAGQRCVNWDSDGDRGGYECTQYESWDAHYVKGTKCRTQREDDNIPAGCTGTARYIDVYADGQLAGQTYYWDQRRPSRW